MLQMLERQFEGFHTHHRDVTNILTAIGAFYVVSKAISHVSSLVKGARLYILSQIPVFKIDYKKRYGQWVVISGSTDGIGLAMAKEFAKRGHSILVIGRNLEKLANTKRTLLQIDNVGEVETVKIDLSDSSLDKYCEIEKQIKPDEREVGILINNAGIIGQKFQRFSEHTMETMRDIVNVNVLGVVLLTKIVMPSMLTRGKGLIVNVSSMVSTLPAPYMSVYGPSKAFVDSFSRMLDCEYGRNPIDIINLNPGGVATNIFNDSTTSSKDFSSSMTPEYYSRVAVNALSTRSKTFTGTISHSFSSTLVESLEALGLPMVKIAMKKFVQESPSKKDS